MSFNGNDDNGIGWLVANPIPELAQESFTAKWCFSDFRVKYCKRCLNVWDINNSTAFCDITYYKDFPKYKLPKADCYVCVPSNYKGKKEIRVNR